MKPFSTLSHVLELHHILKDKNIILAFEGGFTHEVTKHILFLTENQLDNAKEDAIVKKKVFNVMVECLQNIVKHADEIDRSEINFMNDGIFMIGKDDEGYFVISGNFIANKNIPFLEEKINEVNNLDKDGLKDLYKKTLLEGRISSKGGAGLGIIDIARKSGNKLSYHFQPISDIYSFYSLKTKVTRSKED